MTASWVTYIAVWLLTLRRAGMVVASDTLSGVAAVEGAVAWPLVIQKSGSMDRIARVLHKPPYVGSPRRSVRAVSKIANSPAPGNAGTNPTALVTWAKLIADRSR